MITRSLAFSLALSALTAALPAQVEVGLLTALNASQEGTAEGGLKLEEPSYHAFQALGPFILVQVTVDGARGSYILDSGAPGLILNREVTEVVDRGRALDRAVDIGRAAVAELRWGPVLQRHLTAYTLDLSHLERSLGVPIAGMIGYEQLRAATISINYPRKQLTFYPADADASALGIPLKFRLRGHVPTLRSSVAGKRLDLALDTGSGVNILDDDLLGRLAQEDCTAMVDLEIRGLGATVDRVQRRRVHLTEVAEGNWLNLPFAFTDLAGFRESGLRVDGILGREWIVERTLTLDYARRRLYVK